MDAKPLHIRFDVINGFIKIYDGTRHLVLFGPERHNPIYDRISYVISEKSDVIILQDSELIHVILSLQKTLTFYFVIILIKSVFSKINNHCFYNVFLEKELYEHKSNTFF